MFSIAPPLLWKTEQSIKSPQLIGFQPNCFFSSWKNTFQQMLWSAVSTMEFSIVFWIFDQHPFNQSITWLSSHSISQTPDSLHNLGSCNGWYFYRLWWIHW
jgi:hypothetical protein